ncbi:MAG: fumarate hydratase, partial [Erysipelotrichaceae bacterium]|nr:fumarate hydratase [Erysipelotrichaceae bacterium]
MTRTYEEIKEMTAATLVKAASTFREDKKNAYRMAIEKEEDPKARWVLETILENAETAQRNMSPLCDDTGIPHLVLEVGDNRSIDGKTLDAIKEGVREGLRRLPGRPMAIMGDDTERLDQSGGLDPDSGAVEAAPVLLRRTKDDVLRLHILM